ncbi:MAG: aminotransferase class IV, partial [Candidatus Omnitrophota bacterium]
MINTFNNNELYPGAFSGFDLLETILWENGEYFLLTRHLDRLKKTALYFSFPYDEGLLVKFLESYASSFDPEKKYRVRLLLKKNGSHG